MVLRTARRWTLPIVPEFGWFWLVIEMSRLEVPKSPNLTLPEISRKIFAPKHQFVFVRTFQINPDYIWYLDERFDFRVNKSILPESAVYTFSSVAPSAHHNSVSVRARIHQSYTPWISEDSHWCVRRHSIELSVHVPVVCRHSVRIRESSLPVNKHRQLVSTAKNRAYSPDGLWNFVHW